MIILIIILIVTVLLLLITIKNSKNNITITLTKRLQNILFNLTTHISELLSLFKIYPQPKTPFPFHIAIIPDGNRRYYTKRKTFFKTGYDQSLKTILRLVEYCFFGCDVKSVTFFVLSNKNLGRSREEVKIYYGLIDQLKGKMDYLFKKNVKVNIYGDLGMLPEDKRKILLDIEKRSMDNITNNTISNSNTNNKNTNINKNVKNLNLLIAYSSYEEMINKHKFDKVTSNLKLDLFIRTGDTYRFSDFMLESISRGCFCEFMKIYFPSLSPMILFFVFLKYKKVLSKKNF